MDEPTSALDYGNQLRVLQLVRELAGEGYGVLLSTHNPQHALTFATRTLALCDGRTSFGGEEKSNTLFVVDKFPEGEALTAPVEGEAEMMAATIPSYHPGHRWWYFSNMERDDVLLFKFHDSDHARTWRCPHTAFADNSFANARQRASIEVRSVAFFE